MICALGKEKKGKSKHTENAVDKNAVNLKIWLRILFKIMPARDIEVISPIRLQTQIFRTGRDRAKNKTF